MASNPVVPPSTPEDGPVSGDSDPATGHAYLPLAPETGPSLRSKLLKALAVVVAVVVVLVVRATVFGDEARAAEVGDCVAATEGSGGDEVKVVDCGDTAAAYTVVGKVPGTSDLRSKACDQFVAQGEAFSVHVSRTSTGGFLLCLRPRT